MTWPAGDMACGSGGLGPSKYRTQVLGRRLQDYTAKYRRGRSKNAKDLDLCGRMPLSCEGKFKTNKAVSIPDEMRRRVPLRSDANTG